MSLKYHKYRLPFAKPLQTSAQTFEYREGIILEYKSSNVHCYGEIAPLPGYSKETLDEVQQTIDDNIEFIESSLEAEDPTSSLNEIYQEKEWPASLQFGIDSIAYQVLAKGDDTTIQNYLFQESMSEIPVNALGALHVDSFLQDIEQQLREGYETIKFKIGIDFNTELDRLKQIRDRFPNLTIRLDANQAWSPETALLNLQKLEPLRIEYCEEPLREANPENFEALSQQTHIPLALDECVSHVSYWPNLLPYTSYLILKPMLIGSFTKNIETKRLADTHNNEAVFTTSLESGVGRQMTAVLASGLGSPQTAHGLTTGQLLAKDVYSDMAYISKGAYHLNRHHQSGIDLNILGDVSSSSL